jgi:hypothetical protein
MIADPAAYTGQGIVLTIDPEGFVIMAHRSLVESPGNIVSDWAGLAAWRGLFKVNRLSAAPKAGQKNLR